jgi:hypothetical protein
MNTWWARFRNSVSQHHLQRQLEQQQAQNAIGSVFCPQINAGEELPLVSSALIESWYFPRGP